MTPALRLRVSAPDAERWLEALPVAVIGVDATDQVRLVNARAAELLAAAGRGLQGKRLGDVFGAEAPLVKLARRSRENGAPVSEVDLPIEGPGFALGRLSASAAPVGEGDFIAIVLMQPRRPRAAPALANNAARTLAHEVRNPLAGIRAAAQLIGRADDPETAALAKLICDEVDRIGRLTDRIDPLARLDAPRFGPVNVHETLERVRRLIASSAPQVRLREHYDPSLPLVRGDADLLIQAFLNIAKNAVEAIGDREEGEVSLATAFRPGVKFRAAASAASHAQLEVRIGDNGPGVERAVADRLFEPFATTKTGGMGIGLTVAADIIARHGGRIEVESEPGRTVFKILLPIHDESAPA